jgi:GDP-L-fucose synthase
MRPVTVSNRSMGVFHGRRIVVTGGAGFLGRVVVRKLRERGGRDIFIPRRATCDLTRLDHIEKMFDEARPQLLVHLAATVPGPKSHRDLAETFYNNVMMATQLIEAASRHGVEKMIYVGSATSYPSNAAVPLREQDLFKGMPDPGRAEHGIAKRLNDHSGFGLPSTIWVPLRLSDPDEFLRAGRQFRPAHQFCYSVSDSQIS